MDKNLILTQSFPSGVIQIKRISSVKFEANQMTFIRHQGEFLFGCFGNEKSVFYPSAKSQRGIAIIHVYGWMYVRVML